MGLATEAWDGGKCLSTPLTLSLSKGERAGFATVS